MHNIPWPATSDANPVSFPSQTDPDPFDMGGLRPVPVASMWPVRAAPTLRDILPAAHAAGWVHRMGKAILGDEHQWRRDGVQVSWDHRSSHLTVAWDVGTERHPVWDYRLHAWLDPGSPRPLLAQALAHLAAAGIDVPGVTP